MRKTRERFRHSNRAALGRIKKSSHDQTVTLLHQKARNKQRCLVVDDDPGLHRICSDIFEENPLQF